MDNLLDSLSALKFNDLVAPVTEVFSGQPWLQGAAVFLATFLVASLLTWLVFSILHRVTRKTRNYIDDKLLRIAHAPVYYSLVITGFSTAFRIMPLSDRLTLGLISGLKTIGVLVWSIALIRFSQILLKQLARLGQSSRFIQPQTLPLFDNLFRVLIIAVALYITFSIWGIDMTAWLASAGIIGIAVGFAAKDTLANLFSGVFILADTPYKIGDYVVLDNGQRGKVTHIGLRSTRFLTRDDVEITVPNSIVGNSKIINQTGGPHTKFRLRIKIGLAYGSDINRAREILVSIATHEQEVCQSPEPRIRFRAFADSSLAHELLCWVEEPESRGRVTDKLNLAIYNRFREEGIEIPYTKRDVYIKQMPDNAFFHQ